MLNILLILFGFVIKYGNTETNTELPDQFLIVKSYEDDMNTSLQLDKKDKQILTSWNERFQLKQVDLTAEYRTQMMRHRDHNFRTNISKRWEDCIHTFRKIINRMESDYNNEERSCMRTALTAGEEKKQAVIQIEKEKRKWRKGYKYLVNLCKSKYYTKIEIASCIVEYVENDGYNQTLKRLILLKLRAMGELLLQYNKALFDLGECLRINFYKYLTNVRSIMKVLDRCYRGRKNK